MTIAFEASDGLIAPGDVAGRNVVAEAEKWGIGADKARRLVFSCPEGLVCGISAADAAYPAAAAWHEAPSLVRIERLSRFWSGRGAEIHAGGGGSLPSPVPSTPSVHQIVVGFYGGARLRKVVSR